MMNTHRRATSIFLASVLALSTFTFRTQAEDFRSEDKRAEFSGYFEENRVLRLALSLGRSTGAIPASRAEEIYEAIQEHKAFPADLSNDMQKLIRIAQMIVLMQETPNFFTHGYEFETIYPNVHAGEEFKDGAEKFKKLVGETFGLKGHRVYEEIAHYRDGKNRQWKLMLESVRYVGYKDGFELVSPPFALRDDIEQLATLAWRLGEKRFGQSNRMTGGHQTFSLVPVGETANAEVVARTLANMMLMQAQFSTTLYKILDVKRWGGPENFYFRPTVFDYRDMLLEIEEMSREGELSLAKINELMVNKYVDRELEIQAKKRIELEIIDQAEFEEMQNWSKEKKAAYRPVWKYRDLRPKINAKNPEKTLLEVRIGDYVADRPEQAIMETYLYQRILSQAYQMAVRGETFNLNLPVRRAGEADMDYWARLSENKAGSVDALFKAIGLKDEDARRLIQKQSFEVKNPSMRANERTSFAFEIEGHSEALIEFILPRDPKLRLEWATMSDRQKIEKLSKMGFDFDEEFSWEKYRVLVTEFYADTDRYPFLSPDLHLEASGRWEIKTAASGISSVEDLEVAVRKVNRNLSDEYFGLHIHVFFPDSKVQSLGGKNATYFTDFMERLSFFMLARGYADAPVEEPAHYYDSWSLDRYSIKDLEQVLGHLSGRKKITSNLDQKYHNVAFRPVRGGLDIEFRDLDHDIDYGLSLAREIEEVTRKGQFGGLKFDDDKPLFYGFGENAKATEKKFTLETAVAEKYDLTKAQRDLLRKFQFEIYKPSMKEYVYFADFSALNETPDELLDATEVRSNFENNLVMPLLNYAEQSYLSAADKKLLAARRDAFVDRVYKLLLQVEKDSKYDFLTKTDDFLHLCDWLERSTHKNRPNFDLLPSKMVAEQQRELLEELVYELRGLTVRFVRETRVDQMVEKTIDPKTMAKFVGVSKVGASSDGQSAKAAVPKACTSLFKK